MKMLARRLALATLLSSAFFAAHADNTPQALPYAQSWTDTALIAANDNWSGIPGAVGYRGDNITGGTGVDPQTLLGEGTVVVNAIANQTNPNTLATGGVAEFHLTDPVVALNGSGTADAPYLLINLNTTGQNGINVAYNLRDLDGSIDNAVQPVALHYRIGNSGSFINVPAGFVADATTGPSLASLVTSVSALLPAAVDNQSLVQVRIITSNAVGNDEWVGIDDIAIGVAAGPPALTINDASVDEGDSGTTPLFFTFKLSKPAGTGGVSIDYATADGTAIAGSDYTAAAGTVVIPEGQTSVTISIDALGDFTPESHESFVVDIVNASGATVGDAQGAGTIRNEDFPFVPIHDIQGAGLQSAYDGQVVATEGVITARKFFSNSQQHGFFLQSLTPDADSVTSEAVFVFVAGAAPAQAQVGNRVRVIAKVKEYTPSSDPHQLSITELVEPTIVLLETGVALPAAVELTAAELHADAQPGTLEHAESMRVSVARSIVVGAADGRIIEKDATATTNGVFYVTLPDVAVPFREPGMGVLDVTPIPAGKNPPRFNSNPERLMVRSWGQVGSQPLAVDVLAEVSGLSGVLDYADRNWTLLQDVGVMPLATGGKLPQAVNDANYEAVTISGFNLLRFFDEVNDGNGATTLTAAALDKRLGKTALAICDYLKTPDILGVVEVENLRVLSLLAERINTTCARAPGYVAHLIPASNDSDINVGYLISTRDIGAGQARVEIVSIAQHGKDETLTNPNGSTSVLNDRPPLVLRAIVHQDNGAAYPVTVIVNHLRSFLDHDSLSPGTNGWGTEGARVRAKRGAQALYLAGLVQSQQQQDPNEKIVLLGDFNAYAFNDGYTDVMGVIKGEEAPADQVLDYIDSPVTTPLVDGAQLIADPAQRYSYVFDGNAQTLDHVLVNQALLGDALGVSVDHARINAEFGVDNFDDAGTPIRVSDHDPVRVTIVVPAFRSAHLSITANATPPSVRVGETAHFDVNVANAGPNAGEFAAVSFVFEALVTPAINAADGWNCVAPVQGTTTTTITCSTASFAVGDTAAFALDVIAPDSLGGGTLRMAAAISSQIADPANADNQAAAAVGVLADADLSVSLSGPGKKLHYGDTEIFPVVVHNAGTDAAWQPVVTLRGDAPMANVAIVAPAGWQCSVDDDAGNFEANCIQAGAFAANTTQHFDFAITIPARSNSTQFLNLHAETSATTPEPNPANNTARYSNRIVGVP